MHPSNKVMTCDICHGTLLTYSPSMKTIKTLVLHFFLIHNSRALNLRPLEPTLLTEIGI